MHTAQKESVENESAPNVNSERIIANESSTKKIDQNNAKVAAEREENPEDGDGDIDMNQAARGKEQENNISVQ